MAYKVRVVTFECVENERLVCLWDLVVREPSLVRQVHVGRQRACVQAGRLGVQLEVHGLGGLDAQNELVARDALEYALRDVLKLDPHFHFGLVQSLTRAHIRSAQGISCRDLPFPALRMKGTPSHRGLWIHSVVAAKVGHLECGGTVSSSR